MLTAIAAGCGGVGPTDTEVEVEVETLDATTINLGGAPWGVALDGSAVWVSDAGRATLLELDADTGELRREIATGAADPRDTGIAIGGGRVWVANLGGTVGVIDADAGTVLDRIGVTPGEPAAIAFDGANVWVPRHGPGGGLTRIGDETGARDVQAIDLPESGFAVALTGGTVWVTGLERSLFAVDAGTGAVRMAIELPGAPRGVAVSGGDIWVTLRDRRQVVRIDATTGEEVGRIDLEGQPWPIGVGAGAVWVAVSEGQLIRIDPATDQVTASAPVGVDPRAVAVGVDGVWVTSQAGTVTRVELEG